VTVLTARVLEHQFLGVVRFVLLDHEGDVLGDFGLEEVGVGTGAGEEGLEFGVESPGWVESYLNLARIEVMRCIISSQQP
jgi:hypothetical protein